MAMVVHKTLLQLKYLRFSLRGFSSIEEDRRGTFRFINFANQNGVYNLQLNSPGTRNALSLEMLNELRAAFKVVNEAEDSRCVLLSSTGKVFSAGHNLKELTKEIPETHRSLVFSTCTSLMKLLLDCPVPVVAKVDGMAAAAGCQLVAMCDIVVASSSSMFSTPGVNLGIFCSTPGVAIARSIPMKLASYMLYTGLPISAEEALKAGLVSRVVHTSQLEQSINMVLETEIEQVVESIRMKSLPVVRLGKQFLLRQIKMDNIMEAYKEGESVMMNNLQFHDTQEGLQSFTEKRKPQFQDK